ncbi:endoribonuclease XendoU, partial [Cooperia oncophora]
LFVKVDESLFKKPSYRQFLALADNFNRETGNAEPRVSVTEEKRETSTFLTTVLESKPWKALYEFLHRKGHPFASSPIVFRYWIAQLWFVHYSRARGKADTSGFEHVFMGEEKNREISGLHNWLRFYTLERNATENFDYKGFVIKRGTVMASVKFTWKGDLKRSGSILIGTSPEYDMALYTLCFLSRRGRDQCEVEIDGCPLAITSFDIIQNNKVFIGSIFPTAGALTEKCRRLGGRA